MNALELRARAVPRPPTSSPDAIDRAKQRILEAKDMDELRAAQAVLLPLLGLTLDQTAQAVGKSRYWASRARNADLSNSPPPGKHGGRRRCIVQGGEELELLRNAIREAHKQPHLYITRTQRVKAAVRDLLEAKSQSQVADSTVTSFMRRTVPKLMPELQSVDYSDVAQQLEQFWHAEQRLQQATERARPR